MQKSILDDKTDSFISFRSEGSVALWLDVIKVWAFPVPFNIKKYIRIRKMNCSVIVGGIVTIYVLKKIEYENLDPSIKKKITIFVLYVRLDC